MSNIRSMTAFMEAVWDWSMLDGCFGGKIRPMDIDGIVERNGWFLLLEGKGPLGSVSVGQGRTLEALRSTGLFTIIVFWGEPAEKSVTHMRIDTDEGKGDKLPATTEDFRRAVAVWYRLANSRRPPRP